MIHTTKEKLEKGQILASEVIKTVNRCRDSEMTDEEKVYHLDNIASLARDVSACSEEYNENEDVSGLGC